jgi:TPP-dependent indolepyruvate ferredoxin oxidoreductase alpha subunit
MLVVLLAMTTTIAVIMGTCLIYPVLEPSDSQDAKDLMVKAFDISEEYSTPVILKTNVGYL